MLTETSKLLDVGLGHNIKSRVKVQSDQCLESELTPLELLFKTRVVEKRFEVGSSPDFENGCYHRICHASESTKTKMTFGLFLPSSYQNDVNSNTPVMFWLGGLACDDTTLAVRAGGRAFEAADRNVSI